MKHMKFKYYTDAGHGWMAVKRTMLQELGIDEKISYFSYTKGKTVYLEEDGDMGLFFKAYKEKFGHEPTIEQWNHGNRSVIRSYSKYLRYNE